MRSRIALYLMLAIVGLVSLACTQATNSSGSAGNRSVNASNAATSGAASAADSAAVEADVRKLVNEGVAATIKNDTVVLDKLWADNYMFIGQDGVVSTKAQRLESMKTGTTKIEALSYDEISVRSNAEGTGAIVVAKATVKGTSMGKPVGNQVRLSQVWSKTKDGWRQVNSHVTNIAAAADGTSSSAPAAANSNKP